jgi:hypothetical protein
LYPLKVLLLKRRIKIDATFQTAQKTT